jgi:hypothetical protein
MFRKWGLNTEVEADEEDMAAKDLADEEAREKAEKEVNQQDGWLMMNFMQCLWSDARTKYIQECRKKRKVGAVSGKGRNVHLRKRQIQEISTDCVATTISAMITVDPQDQEEGPSAMLETASAARGTRSNTRS